MPRWRRKRFYRLRKAAYSWQCYMNTTFRVRRFHHRQARWKEVYAVIVPDGFEVPVIVENVEVK